MEPHVYKEWIAGIFDRAAESYGKKHSSFFDYFAKNLVSLAALPPGAHVLDVATGRGAILKQIAAAVGPLGKAVGVDISSNMIEQTAKDLADYPHVQLLCGDAEQLEFDEHSFDYLFCGFGVFFFPHALQALQGFFKLLKPGGRLLISTWGKEDDICSVTLQEALNEFGPQIKTRLHEFHRPDFIWETLSSCGFVDIKTTSDELDHVYPTFDDWFSSLWSYGGRGKLEKLTFQQLIELKESLHTRLHPYLKPDGLHKFLQAYYTQAMKPGEDLS